ncbi:hypothetical protein I3842_01G120800 [Carya illinoinensis]|uniref:Uncharacterized protein n=1 Tax=Carya illinoinensis TaxID=32201 RepID=A0A922K417_CARIL|nr:hypothetical protein I3842_01G120800 [Carya illinoinensis]
MADRAVGSLLDKLLTLFVENEVQPLRGDPEDVLNLRGELERMRAFLKVADALEESDVEFKVRVKQIREIAHETEDALDEFMLLQAHDHADGFYGALHKFSCCIKNMKARHRIISELQGIRSRIKNLCQLHGRLLPRFTRIKQGLGSTTAENTWQDRRGDALLLDKTDLVGIDEPKQHLVEWLVKGDNRREVISVAAMGGMGKTTLAKQVYDDEEVKKHFKRRAWVTVSQSFKIEELLKNMIRDLQTSSRGLDNMNNDRLRRIIKDLLKKSRYLVVLDDVWHLNEWDVLKYALPDNNCGSRVMLTTRNAGVASSTSSGVESVVESWGLFCKKTFQGNACPTYLKDICQYTLRNGVLASKDTRRIDEWDVVRRSLGAEIDGNDKLQDLKKVLLLNCFLYLSIFPEDYKIEQMRLIRLWIAEGLIEAKEGKTLEEVAEDYLNELLNRGLLQLASLTSDGRVKTYRVHDVLREIIVSKSRDQNFTFIAKDQNVMWPDKVRRLSIHNTLQNVPENKSVSRLRSLFMFGVVEKLKIQSLFPGGFKLLNVLDLQKSRLKRFPIDVENLVYLKYLSLKDTEVKTIPRTIGKLRYLETLDLKHSRVTELPVEILKLHRLRHLLIYHFKLESYEYFHSRYGFKIQGNIGALRSLQKLCFIEANQGGGAIMVELGKLYQLRRLGIVKLRKEDGKSLCSSLKKLSNLLALSLTSIEEEEILDLQHLSYPPPLIQRVYLTGRLETLPPWIPSLHGLEDPLVLLQKLPNLVHLELLQGGFNKLKVLGLDQFSELRCVQVEVGAMPCVEKLIILRCELLEKVPVGIEYLTTLKFIQTLRPDEKDKIYCTYLRPEGGWEEMLCFLHLSLRH